MSVFCIGYAVILENNSIARNDMSKRIVTVMLGVVVLLLLFGFRGDFLSLHNGRSGAPQTSVLVDDGMLERIAELPLRKRIGQLMIFGFATTTPDEHIVWLISEYGVGGVNLLRRNVRDAEQMRRLTAALQRETATASLPLMFIATDQEGGAVNRFFFLSEKTAQSDIENEAEAFLVGERRGRELRNLGVNMNFSPVLDFAPDTRAYLYTRTFATTTDAIARLGVALARGYESGGVIPVFKHFPGYGVVVPDPHTQNASVQENGFLEQSLRPFRLALETKPDTPLMTAHSIYAGVDVRPATRSRRFLRDILRNEWGYDGVIITDDLEMESVKGAEKLPVEEVAVQALEAGADMLISTYTSALHEPIIKAVEGAVASGRLSEERINQSVRRVWRLKATLE